MIILDYFRSGLAGLQSYKLRALLTALGIIFGVAAVISMLAIGEGAREEALESIRRIGLDNILVKQGGKDENDRGRLSRGLTSDDFSGIKRIIPGIEEIVVVKHLSSMTVSSSEFKAGGTVFGITGNFLSVLDLGIKEGAGFIEPDQTESRRVTAIGSNLRRELFGFSNPIGKKIRLKGGQNLEVVCALENVPGGRGESSSILLTSPNQNILMPMTTLSSRFLSLGQRGLADEAILNISPGENMFEIAHLIKNYLLSRHNGVEDFTLVVPEALLIQKQKTQKIFSLVMGCIAGISLLVGGIGIMNIMLATVTERTREIGIRRALGARKMDILAQFLAESTLISFGGGLLGIIFGLMLSSFITRFAGWETIISLYSIILAFAVSVAVGLVFGVYPAAKAANLNPIEALRYE